MNLVFNKKQIISLVILLSLVLILPLALFLTQQRQEVRKKAEEIREEIVLSLNPQTNDQASPWPAGHEQIINIKMRNITSDKTLKFRVVGLELNFNPQVFETQTADLQCNSPFVLAGGNASKVDNNIISLICYVPPAGADPGEPQKLSPGTQMTVGSFKVKVKPNPPGGRTDITFARSNIPEETSLEDLSKYGEEGTYYIAGAPITGTPTSTSTPTLTPTTTPSQCDDNGDINLDGRISETDIMALLISWSPNGPVPTPRPGFCDADLNNDGRVSETDIMKLLLHWNP
jgi:hypothetical protein